MTYKQIDTDQGACSKNISYRHGSPSKKFAGQCFKQLLSYIVGRQSTVLGQL